MYRLRRRAAVGVSPAHWGCAGEAGVPSGLLRVAASLTRRESAEMRVRALASRAEVAGTRASAVHDEVTASGTATALVKYSADVLKPITITGSMPDAEVERALATADAASPQRSIFSTSQNFRTRP